MLNKQTVNVLTVNKYYKEKLNVREKKVFSKVTPIAKDIWC